jgi:hypothetical protein
VIRPELVKEAVEYIRVRTANYEYFFERLDSIDWIGPLREYGFFKQPPAPTREGDTMVQTGRIGNRIDRQDG